MFAWAVHAGFPSPADDHVERSVDLNDVVVLNRIATFLMLVEGDIAVVDRSLASLVGYIVLVFAKGSCPSGSGRGGPTR